jgi:hypothetical protein
MKLIRVIRLIGRKYIKAWRKETSNRKKMGRIRGTVGKRNQQQKGN